MTSLSAHDENDRVAVLVGVYLERHPLLDGVVARDDALDGLVELLALGLGEEPDMTEVDPEQRDPRPAGQLGPPQDRAVATEHADELAARPPSRVRRRVGGRGRLHPGDRSQRRAVELVGGGADADTGGPEAGGDVGGELLRLGRPMWVTRRMRRDVVVIVVLRSCRW